MRAIWIGFIFIICPCSLYSQTTIKITQKKWNAEEERSLSYLPLLRQEGDIITIYSDVLLEDLLIEIRDLSGTLISQDIITVPAGTTYSIDITNLTSGDYTFKISQEGKYIIGYFNR